VIEIDDSSVSAAPFLRLTHANGQVRSRGLPSCRLGQPLDFGRAIPDGVYAEWTLVGSQLVARNDRYGLRPLFFFCEGAEFGISPSLPRLLLEGAPAELDEPALAVFLRTGYYVGEDTAFRAIRALPPGATLAWTAGQLQVTGGLKLPKPRELSRDEAIDAYIPLFREAVRRHLPSDHELVMPLSGGRDSRHILFEAIALGSRPRYCLTVRHHLPRTDADAELASQIAGALGLPHVVLDQTEPRLRAESRKNLLTSFCSDEGTAFLALGDHLAGQSVRVFDGIGGDFLSDGRFVSPRRLELLADGRIAELADDLLWRQPYITNLLADDVAARLRRQVAVARLQAELERHLDAPNPIASYIFATRCRREIATFPFNFYDPGIEVRCPYLDTEVFDFLISLPTAVFVPPSFHADTIRRAFPAYAHIAFESPTLTFDERYAHELRSQLAALDASLDEATPRLLSAKKLRATMMGLARLGRAPAKFTAFVIYALQLERFVDRLPR
jgi:asparagine synthase (glutamine-hydrolysing)